MEKNTNLKTSSSLLNPYKYESPDSGVSFHFTTDHGIEYSLAIGDYSEMFGLPDNYPCRLQFFLVTRINRPDKVPIDRRIKDTIISFSIEYLDKNPHIIFYVCSNKDGKERARQLMFDEWFKEAGKQDVSKEVRIINNNETYFIFKNVNQLAKQIILGIDEYMSS
jgi:hypothetical protein